MSLFSSINQSAAALRASQLGLQVVGHNIANANTPGYIRQELELVPATATRLGRLIVGQGVLPRRTTQVIDQALAQRMWSAGSAVAAGETLNRAYVDLESMIGGMDGQGLGAKLSTFNEALHNLANSPADTSSRDFVLMQAQALTTALNQAHADGVRSLQRVGDEIPALADMINSSVERISELNLEIMILEGGRAIGSDATGLREERYNLLEQLARIVDITVQEQRNGAVSVFVGGDYLVADSNFRGVYVARGQNATGREVRIRDTDSPLITNTGSLSATQKAGGEVFGGYLEKLDQFARELATVVNQVHASGQGLRGLTNLTGTVPLQQGVPLSQAGLDFTPKNGSFDIQLVDERGELISNHRIAVQRLGTVTDSTINSIVADINAIDGISARIDSRGRLEIHSDIPGVGYTFHEDTSGFLAGAGLNTFFVGTSASTLAVNPALLESPELLSISRHGIRNDTDALLELVDLIRRPIPSLDGQSLEGSIQHSINQIAQSISLNRAATAGADDYYKTLRAQHLSVTGVNLDEEAIKMVMYQRAFQASSRVIATASEMLELLVSL